jgi:hypothetical protein
MRMIDSRPTRARLLSSLAIVLAASAFLAPAAVYATSPGPAACEEYSVCGGPTGPASGGGGKSGAQPQTPPGTSGWFHLPVVDYPVTAPVAILGAALLGSAVAIGIAVRVRARPGAATQRV